MIETHQQNKSHIPSLNYGTGSESDVELSFSGTFAPTANVTWFHYPTRITII